MKLGFLIDSATARASAQATPHDAADVREADVREADVREAAGAGATARVTPTHPSRWVTGDGRLDTQRATYTSGRQSRGALSLTTDGARRMKGRMPEQPTHVTGAANSRHQPFGIETYDARVRG